MTVLVEGKNSFFLTAQATLIEDGRELAWAEKYVLPNPANRWVLGKFVEADNPNSNRHYWTLDSLQMARPTISHAPMNMLHRHHHIVGAFVATDLIYPTEEEAAVFHPYIEALGVFWKYYFPSELQEIEAAHADGSLYYSMECVAESVTCAGDGGCGVEFAYKGPVSESYCEHLNQGPGIKQLNKPHFTGGALVIPPHKPGLKTARITELAMGREWMESMERAYEEEVTEESGMTAEQWYAMMSLVMKYCEAKSLQTV